MAKKRTLELIYAKEMGDGRTVTQEIVDQIVNTHSQAAKYPVAKGHDAALGLGSDAIPAAGFVTNLRMMGRSAVGDVVLTDQVDQEYNDGLWPGWSIGIKRSFIEQDGNRVYGDWQMGHLALLGSTEPAFKDLQDLTGIENFSENGETAEFSAKDHEYMVLAVTSKDLSPSDSVSKPKSAEVGSKTNKEEEMEAKELEMKLSAAQEQNEALQAKLEVLLSERKEASKANFRTTGKAIFGRLQDLGVSEAAREDFSKSVEALEELAADGADFTALFTALTSVLSEVKPKVTPGDSAPRGEADEQKSAYASARAATSSLFGSSKKEKKE